MTPFTAAHVMEALTPFQRNTAEHVIDRLYRDGASRFLVADETGLGKTIVARGVVARAIKELQHAGSRSVGIFLPIECWTDPSNEVGCGRVVA